MSELVLHIGTHKTGTTALQEALAAARHRLKAQGLVYPTSTPASPVITGWSRRGSTWRTAVTRGRRQSDFGGGSPSAAPAAVTPWC